MEPECCYDDPFRDVDTFRTFLTQCRGWPSEVQVWQFEREMVVLFGDEELNTVAGKTHFLPGEDVPFWGQLLRSEKNGSALDFRRE